MRRLRCAAAGAAVFLVLAIVAGAAAAWLGLPPVGADVAPSPPEAWILSHVLRAAVARRALMEARWDAATDTRGGQDRGATASTADLAAGAEIYEGACARCHGKIAGGTGTLGAALYPPAPQLPGHRSRFTEGELFYVVKHGIRMTGMPAWSGLLSDRDIARVSAVVARFSE